MRFLLLLVLLFPLFTLSVGCGASDTRPKPKNDPNWVDTSDPSKAVVPDSLKKGPAGGKTAPAPGGEK